MVQELSRAQPLEIYAGPYDFAGHSFGIRGQRAPIAEVRLEGNSALLLDPVRLLWCEPQLRLLPGPLRKQRSASGEQPALVVAHGRGLLALSPECPCQVVMLYLPARRVLEVQAGRWLCAAALSYVDAQLAAGLWLDRFSAGDDPGLLILSGPGDLFELVLQAGEHLDLRLGVLLYKDQSVTIVPVAGSRLLPAPDMLVRCSGPGLIALHSAGFLVGGWHR